MIIHAVCSWLQETGDEKIIINRPSIDDYTHTWQDITGTPIVPCKPNMVVVKAVVDDKQLAAIQADKEIKILYDEKQVDVKPSVADVGQVRTWLTERGLPTEEAVSAVATAKTMEAISDDLRVVLAVKPKADADEKTLEE